MFPELSAFEWMAFAIAVLMIMAYHGWFFIYTSIRSDRAAAEAETQAAREAWEDAIQDGSLIELEDARQARRLKDRDQD